MHQPVAMALEATRRLRSSAGYRNLSSADRAALGQDLSRIEAALTGRDRDPYSVGLADSPAGAAGNGNAAPPPPPPAPPPPPSTSQIGGRAAEALAAVNFTGFVAGLVTGTFQAIVDATAQQVKEYASLVASISQSVESFSRDNVSPGQVRAWLAERYASDLQVLLPPAGAAGAARLIPQPASVGTSPAWLANFGLQGEELSEELTEGVLLDAGQPRLGEERLQTLATMVLMGINRIVVDDGDIKARLQFHAVARDLTNAEMAMGQMAQGIAGRQVSAQSAVTTMVSTLKANAQADASIKADLMGEVRIKFRSETFPLDRFADGPAIQLLNRHARWTSEPAKKAAPPAPVSVPTPEGGE